MLKPNKSMERQNNGLSGNATRLFDSAANSGSRVPWWADDSLSHEEKDDIAAQLAADYAEWSYDRLDWNRG